MQEGRVNIEYCLINLFSKQRYPDTLFHCSMELGQRQTYLILAMETGLRAQEYLNWWLRWAKLVMLR